MRNCRRLIGSFIAALVLAAPAAFAHVHLKSSSPADGSTVPSAPKELQLNFEDEVHLTSVSLAGANGKAQTLKAPTETVKQATVALPALAPGDYTVNWRAAGHDGHVMSGHVKFKVAGASAK